MKHTPTSIQKATHSQAQAAKRHPQEEDKELHQSKEDIQRQTSEHSSAAQKGKNDG